MTKKFALSCLEGLLMDACDRAARLVELNNKGLPEARMEEALE